MTASKLLKGVILHDQIPIHEMPAVQLTSLLQDKEAAATELLQSFKRSVIKAVFEEIGENNIDLFSVPSLEDLVGATKDSSLNWDAYANFRHNESQPLHSFEEQKKAIKHAMQMIDRYCDILSHQYYDFFL